MSVLESAQSNTFFLLDPPAIKDLYERSTAEISQGSQAPEIFYDLLRQHFYLAIFTGNDAVAKVTLERLSDRFGSDNSHIGVMKSQYLEATQGFAAADHLLGGRALNDGAAVKRRAALSKAQGDIKEYIKTLNLHVAMVPTDTEAWAELSEAYAGQGLYAEAVHALEDAILLAPLAYNLFARLGELLHLDAVKGEHNGVETQDLLRQAVKYFLRSIELCPNYVRGWAGVYVVAAKVTSSETHVKLRQKARDAMEFLIARQEANPKDIDAAKRVLSS